jgi:regulatory protein
MERRRAVKKLDANGLWEYALRALSQRGHSAAELRQKLARRSDSPTSLAAAIAKLREYGFADDAKFSETFAQARLQNQGFGRMRVLRDLQSKRVNSSVAQKAVEKTFENTDEIALATQFLEKKFRGRDLRVFLKDQKELASAYRRLRTAGFSGRVALTVLKSYSSQTVDWEEPPED